MKLVPFVPLVVAATASIAAATDAPVPINATSDASATNAIGINAKVPSCQPLGLDAPQGWFYNSKSGGSFSCKVERDYAWSMLNAYRSGGTEGVHWKYTNDANDRECLQNWKYYASDGTTLVGTIPGRVTTANDPRQWCAMAVYRSGGVRGKQWDTCYCTDDPFPPSAGEPLNP